MNRTIIDNINAVIGEDDILIHDGDLSFGGFDSITEFRNQIICKNIILVLGNHDHHIKKNKNDIQSLFSSVHSELQLTVEWNVGTTLPAGKAQFHISHHPYASWPNLGDGVIHLHGHIHSTPAKKFGIYFLQIV